MAEPKIILERTYNVPLRREFIKVPRYQRAEKAMRALKQFLSKHLKSEDIRVQRYLNLEIWKDGMRNPPHHVKVDVKKYDDGKVTAELVGAPVEAKAPERKKKAPAKAEEASKETKEKEILEETKVVEEKPKKAAAPKKTKEAPAAKSEDAPLEVKKAVKKAPAKKKTAKPKADASKEKN